MRKRRAKWGWTLVVIVRSERVNFWSKSCSEKEEGKVGLDFELHSKVLKSQFLFQTMRKRRLKLDWIFKQREAHFYCVNSLRSNYPKLVFGHLHIKN